MDELTRDLLAARHGDRLAFAAAVRRSQADVWRFCAHLGGRDVADDLTQETYTRVARALPAFRGDASGRTWLLAIARRACADAIRRRVRERRRGVPERPEAAERDASGEIALTDLLEALDTDQRAAFVLTQLHGLSYQETASVCRVPVGTVRSRVARARAALVDAIQAAEAR
jgi:RNA polymerase sigma-70 factor (ECF subfamily)